LKVHAEQFPGCSKAEHADFGILQTANTSAGNRLRIRLCEQLQLAQQIPSNMATGTAIHWVQQL
jgi:hypothetical protein